MSSSSTDPTKTAQTDAAPTSDKGKGKAEQVTKDVDMDAANDSDEESSDEESGDESSEEEEEEDSLQEIDPDAILPRRTRGVKVDYTSAEALAKADLKPDDKDDDDEEM
ncbi:histone H2A.Z-specific chaperone CHZ1, partial [Flagelloscypha sp. PMI_526]